MHTHRRSRVSGQSTFGTNFVIAAIVLLTAFTSVIFGQSAINIPSTGLALWLKADAGTPAAGSRVSIWSDQSSNHADASQANGVNQPLATLSASGARVVRFDGASDFMSFVAPLNGLTGATLILVASAAQDYTGDWNGTSNAPLFWNETAYWGCVHLSPFQTSVKYRFGTTQTNNLPAFTRPVSIGSGLSITTAVKNGTTESLFINGSNVLTQSGKYSTINGIAGTGTLGRGYNSTYFAGDIAEVLVYRRALSDAERAQIESYLISKYIAAPPTTNQAPSVSVGPAATVTYPAAASLTGTASDDGLPNSTLTYTWTKVSGPGDVTLSSPNAANTSATFSAAGQYCLRLTVSDSQLTASADVQVTSVAPAPPSAVPTSGL